MGRKSLFVNIEGIPRYDNMMFNGNTLNWLVITSSSHTSAKPSSYRVSLDYVN